MISPDTSWSRSQKMPAIGPLTRPRTGLAQGVLLSLALLACGGGQAKPTANDQRATGPGAGSGTSVTTAIPAAPSLRLPTTARPTGYEATLNIDPNKDDFRGTIVISLEVLEAIDHLWLNAQDIAVASASLSTDDGTGTGAPPTPVALIGAPSAHFVGFSFGRVIQPGPATLSIEYAGKIGANEVDGVFKQQAANDSYVYTQFESISARAAFPCFDEPTYKVPWTLHLVVPDGMKAYANAPLVERRRNDNGSYTFDFAETPPMSTYLVAFAVGPFEEVELPPQGRNKVPGRIITLRDRQADAAYAVEHMGEIVTWLEDYFDMALPYAKLDHIAVPKFFGAMENPGLITYASRILQIKADELSSDREQAFWVVAAHEIAHHWFGDYVTLDWWDDLWLNESFATWLSEKLVRSAHPEWNRDIEVVRDAQTAMNKDAQASARPVRVPIDSMATIDDLFSLVSYEKGNAMLTMFEKWIGDDKFRDGVRAYIRAHAWQTATAGDFLDKIGAASDTSIPSSFRTFLDQPGVPLVRAKLACSKERTSTPVLNLSQERFQAVGTEGLTALTWHIPVCVRYGQGKTNARTCKLMTEATLELPLPGSRCPDWVIANAGGSGYYRVVYDGDLAARFIADGARGSVNERISALGDLEAAVQTGDVALKEVLGLAQRLGKDKEEYIVRAAIGLVDDLEEHLVPPALMTNYRRFLIKTFGAKAKALGMSPRKGEPESTRQLRERVLSLLGETAGEPTIVREATSLASTWLESQQGIDPGLVELMLGIAAANGDAVFYQRLVDAAKAAKDRDVRKRLTGALASVKDPALVANNLKLILDGPFEFQETFEMLSGAMANPLTRDASYLFLTANFDAVASKLPLMMRGYLAYFGSAFCEAERESEFKAFMEPRLASLPNSKVAYERSLDSIRMCAANKAAQGPGLAAFLEKQ